MPNYRCLPSIKFGLMLYRLIYKPSKSYICWSVLSFSLRIWNRLRFTSRRWYQSLWRCCSLLFCNNVNCAFKTSTNKLSTPNFLSSLGMSSCSKSISEIIDLLVTLILSYHPFVQPGQYRPKLNPISPFKMEVLFWCKCWNEMRFFYSPTCI